MASSTYSNSSRSTMIPMMGLVVLMLVAAMMLLGQGFQLTSTTVQKSAAEADLWIKNWIPGQQTYVREGLGLSEHTRKNIARGRHTAEEVDRVYKTLLEGRCVASVTLCGDPGEFLHLCVIPGLETHTVAGLIQIGREIFTAHEGTYYWNKWATTWHVCGDNQYLKWLD